jgi:hypothetical protein
MSRSVLGPMRTTIQWTAETLPGWSSRDLKITSHHPCSAEVTNKWNPTCIYAYAFRVCTLRSLCSHVWLCQYGTNSTSITHLNHSKYATPVDTRGDKTSWPGDWKNLKGVRLTGNIAVVTGGVWPLDFGSLGLEFGAGSSRFAATSKLILKYFPQNNYSGWYHNFARIKKS